MRIGEESRREHVARGGHDKCPSSLNRSQRFLEMVTGIRNEEDGEYARYCLFRDEGHINTPMLNS
jgi:hypothetical protein